jgi:hypothetical protein
MLTKDELEQMRGVIQDELEAVEKRVTSKIETVDLKVKASRAFNKQAHTEMMETLLDIGDINYQELQKDLKDLKKRVEQLEGKQQN